MSWSVTYSLQILVESNASIFRVPDIWRQYFAQKTSMLLGYSRKKTATPTIIPTKSKSYSGMLLCWTYKNVWSIGHVCSIQSWCFLPACWACDCSAQMTDGVAVCDDTVWRAQKMILWFRTRDLYVCSRIYVMLWSSGKTSWLQTPKSRVRFPALPDFLCSNGSRMGSTQLLWG
jgi:hypothetical protein